MAHKKKLDEDTNKSELDFVLDDPESLAIEVDDTEISYQPNTDSQVVIVEPLIISVGRSIKKRELRNLPPEQK